jgi:3-methyl-2-oxobutanoate hydroxymethyltransferase
MVTAYDATFAHLLDQGGADVLLVGDSLGMVVQGHEDTLKVTLEQMVYHTKAVCAGSARAHVVADLPFLTYQVTTADALRAAGRLLQEGGAQSVKLEGCEGLLDTIAAMVRTGIPVMGHLGLTPQRVHELGGFKVQAKSDAAANLLLEQARQLESAGCYALVLEAIPAPLAARVTAAVQIPTIGIGAGPACDGQVLVCYDFLGMIPEFKPRFVKRYEQLGDRIVAAMQEYGDEVRAHAFPASEHSFGETLYGLPH